MPILLQALAWNLVSPVVRVLLRLSFRVIDLGRLGNMMAEAVTGKRDPWNGRW